MVLFMQKDKNPGSWLSSFHHGTELSHALFGHLGNPQWENSSREESDEELHTSYSFIHLADINWTTFMPETAVGNEDTEMKMM